MKKILFGAMIGALAVAAGACGSGSSAPPCSETMPGMQMCSQSVPAPALQR